MRRAGVHHRTIVLNTPSEERDLTARIGEYLAAHPGEAHTIITVGDALGIEPARTWGPLQNLCQRGVAKSEWDAAREVVVIHAGHKGGLAMKWQAEAERAMAIIAQGDKSLSDIRKESGMDAYKICYVVGHLEATGRVVRNWVGVPVTGLRMVFNPA